MKTLHKIFSGLTEAYIWVNIVGGNGAQITKFCHLMRAERGEPPIMGDDRAYRRSGWQPWARSFSWMGASAVNILSPLCGQLKSKSKWPQMRIAFPTTWRDPNECPDCIIAADEMHITPKYANILRDEDPWTKIGYYDRETTRDPISGK